MESAWTVRLRRIQAEAQTGLEYARDAYDAERYTRIQHEVAALLGDAAGFDEGAVRALFAHDVGYATPKVDVRGAVIERGEVLLVRERTDGLWTLPGGWADIDETPAQCVAREVREESGLEVTVRKLAAVFDRRLHAHPPHRYHIYKLFFLCERTGGDPCAGDETLDARFFPPGALPPLSVGRVTAAQIARMFEHAGDPALPTDFD